MKRLLLSSLVAITGLNVACANVDGWETKPSHAPLPAEFVEASPQQVAAACRRPMGAVFGCALRDYADDVCLIFADPHPPRWIADHERKHCLGYDHR